MYFVNVGCINIGKIITFKTTTTYTFHIYIFSKYTRIYCIVKHHTKLEFYH